MVFVSDIWSDAELIFGTCDESRLFLRINDAIELLANKGEWQPLHAYLDVVADGRTVALPAEVETPLAVSLDGNPALGQDKLFSFHINGPGDTWCDCRWKWRDSHQHGVMVDPDGTKGIAVYSTVADDAGLEVIAYGTDVDGNALRTEVSPGEFVDGLVLEVQYPTASSFSTVFPKNIVNVVKPETKGRLALKDSGGEVLADMQHYETNPRYRRIEVSKTTAAVRVFFRRTTFKVSRQTDWIPLPQRYALTLMMRALKAYDDEQLSLAMAYEAQASRMTAEKNFRLQPPVNMPIQINTEGTLYDFHSDCFGGD